MTDIYKKFLILEQEYAVFKCIILQKHDIAILLYRVS